MLKVIAYTVNDLFHCVNRRVKYYSTTAGTMSNPIVRVREGKLKGAVDTLHDGSPFYSFKGIPYAEPPIGPLRFQAPIPKKPWSGILDAIEHGPVCLQPDMMSKGLQGDEDCLYLNVYTKNLNPPSKTPVMVFIHGGAFMTGSGNDELYGPKFLLQHDIVLVTLNYRLEVLGFLCLDTPEIPGNAGMKDQVAALRWVQSNIESFGGDPNNVTLLGESAGAASVTYHLISPMSKGLFHKAIAQSGNCISDWAQGKEGKERAIRAAKYLKKDTRDIKELVEFFKSVPAKDFVKLTFRTATVDEKHRLLPIHFAPVIEKKFDNVEPFLTEEPMDLILSNKICNIPLMTGYNSAEAIIMLLDRVKKVDFYNKHSYYNIPREIAQRVPEEKMREMGERVKKFYVGERDFTKDDLDECEKLLSDINFIYNAHRFVHLYSKFNKHIYMYKFSLDSELNFLKIMSPFKVKGACHADELFYLFSSNLTANSYEEDDKLKQVVWRVTKMWADFARTSDPTPDNSVGIKWPRFTASGKEYINIDEVMEIGSYTEKERVEFWNKLYCETGLPCINKSNL